MNLPRTERAAVLAAPTLIFLYGVVRLVDSRDGDHGPGPAWTVGHLLFLAAFLCYTVVVLAFRRLADRTVPATLATVAAAVGIAAFLRVIAIDLVVGFRAADNAAMDRIGDEYDRWPGNLGVYDALYEIGPILFVAGLLTLTVLLVRRRLLPWWSPAALLAGFACIIADLDLMPVAGVLLAAAALPLVSGRDARERIAGG